MKKLTALALMMCLTMVSFAAFAAEPTAATSGTVFADVPATHWACESIESAFAKGILVGNGDGTFGTDQTLTRAQEAQVLYNAYGGNGLGDYPVTLSDVANDAWYHDAAVWAVQNSLVDAADGLFHPDDPATRWFMADTLYRTAQKMGVPLPTTSVAKVFPDVTDHAEAINALQRAGIIAGMPDGTFDPNGNLTRAQMATVMDAYTDIEGLAPGTNMSKPTAPVLITPPTEENPATQAPISAIEFSAIENYMGGWSATISGKFTVTENITNMEVEATFPNPEDDYFQSTSMAVKDVYATNRDAEITRIWDTSHTTYDPRFGKRTLSWYFEDISISSGSVVTMTIDRSIRYRHGMDVVFSINLNGIKVYEWTGRPAWTGDVSETVGEWSILD